MPYFIDAALGSCYQLFEKLTGFDTSEKGPLAQCDVGWWMSRAVETLPNRAMEVISGFFNEVHIAVSPAPTSI